MLKSQINKKEFKMQKKNVSGVQFLEQSFCRTEKGFTCGWWIL